MALPALIPAGGLIVKGAFSGILSATAALKAAVAATAAGVAGAAGFKAAAGASAKRAAGASAKAAASATKGARRGYTKEEFYAKAAKAKKYSTDTGSGYSTAKDAAEATGKGVKGALRKIKGFISKASKIITWPLLLFRGSSYQGKRFGVSFNGVNAVEGENGTYYVPAVGLRNGGKRYSRNGYRSSKYKSSDYSSRENNEKRYASSNRSRNDWNRPSYPRR